MNSSLKIFIDFDGTITTKDVGEFIFNKFGNPEVVASTIELLFSQSISARECWNRLFSSIHSVNIDEFNSSIDSISVDPYLLDFVNLCNSSNIDFYVISDGFDYYINRILKREGLQNIKIFANKLVVTEKGNLIPSYPYYDQSFTNSANCKRNHIINLSSDEDYTIFIGDGNSDMHTAVYCDFIFAKNDLIKYCQKQSITYFPYKDFSDVIVKLESLLQKKRLKKRHQAVLKRKELYMLEP